MTYAITTRLFRHAKNAFLLLILSLFISDARGEEPSAPPDPEPAPKNAEPVQSNGAKSQQPSKQSGETSGDFIPSEEISEDFAVSFPVDI